MTESESSGLGLFEGIGIEIEYAIVDAQSLAVAPIADRVLSSLAGEPASVADLGDIAASNELVLHVLELKTNGPRRDLAGAGARFSVALDRVKRVLAPLGAQLMPTAMHPLMDPMTETRLWPHEQNEIYRTFDRLFGCRGHGWSNLQSLHINLPFQGDEEFGRLHAAIRMVLPLLPALAASSPVVEGNVTGLCDNRLEYYRHNAAKLPSVAGKVIPERAFSRADYDRFILDPIAHDVAKHDPDEVLEAEWTNSRGAIARFVRDSIEIRVLDTQECPSADLAVAEIVVRTVRALTDERWISGVEQRSWEVDPLAGWFVDAIRHGDEAILESAGFLRAFGVTETKLSMRDLWTHLAAELVPADSEWSSFFAAFQRKGCLAGRIKKRLGSSPKREEILEVYRELCECLSDDRPFT